jgi:hypothetical protein
MERLDCRLGEDWISMADGMLLRDDIEVGI